MKGIEFAHDPQSGQRRIGNERKHSRVKLHINDRQECGTVGHQRTHLNRKSRLQR